MANKEQIDLLGKGVEEWNKWREKYPKEKIDLSGLDLLDARLNGINLKNAKMQETIFLGSHLTGADLSFTDLSSALLNEAVLHGANLNSANLSQADLQLALLTKAYLNKTNLSKSNLTATNLVEANLNNTNLSEATLILTDLSSAKVEQSDFTNVCMQFTYLLNLDLSKVKGLDSVYHQGPSSINNTTFLKSKGKIPIAFLKGCGLKDWEIPAVELYNPSLTLTEVTDIIYKIDELRNSQPIQVHNLFISYSHKDTAFAERMEQMLDAKGIRCWRDVKDAPSGPLKEIVVREMKDRVVLLICSEHSMNSDWVEFEIENARKLEKAQGRNIICPLTIDNSLENSNWSPMER